MFDGDKGDGVGWKTTSLMEIRAMELENNYVTIPAVYRFGEENPEGYTGHVETPSA